MGAVLGALLGLLYAAVQRWLPVAWPIKGLLFGVMFAALIIWPFTQGLDGEAALAAPWIGATLFGLLPLLFCPALAYTLHRLERPLVARTPRPVGLFWFLAFVGALGFAFVSMLALGETIRIPQLVSQGLEGTGVAFHAMRELLGVGGALLGLLFCLLHIMVLWVGFDRPALKTASIVQLLLAGLLIRNTPWLPFLVGTNVGAWGEWVAWLGLALLILITMLWTGRRPAWRTAFISMGSFGLVFLLLWLAILLTPTMQLRGITGLQTAVTVAPYLIIWLLLPLRLSWMGWRRSR